MLIAFEGGEGCGKSTQIKLLKQFLQNKGFKVLDIVEPGGTPLGAEIRKILLNRTDLDLLGITEAFLFSASRAQQIRTVTVPALNEGTIVISDRSYFSTFAYQGYGREQSIDTLKQLTEIAVGEIKPDLVIFLNIPPEIGLQRKADQKEINRLDAEKLDFHQKVRKGYLQLAAEDPIRWKVIDANRSIPEVQKEISNIVEEVLR